GAGGGRGNDGRRTRRADRLRAGGRAGGGLARPARRAVLGGGGAPGQPGRGLPGPDQGRGRVPGSGAVSAPAIAPRRPDLDRRGSGFGSLLHAEWTKFRTVRGWVIGMIIAAP